MDLDRDLDDRDASELRLEVRRLRAAIRAHRDATGHDLCWRHPKMWALLPDQIDPKITVPEWPQFMRGCVRYRASLDQDAPNAPRTDQELSD